MARALAGMALLVVGSPALAAPFAPIGPDGGVIRRIVVDPQTPTTLYLSTNTAVFKSTDDGLSWVERDAGFPPGTSAYRLAIDPSMPTTVYAGLFLIGVARTTNAGATWTVLPGSPPNVRSLDVDPVGHVYVGDFSGVWRSADGGTTWSFTHLGGGVEALAADPVNAGTVYAATLNFGLSGDNVYRSTEHRCRRDLEPALDRTPDTRECFGSPDCHRSAGPRHRVSGRFRRALQEHRRRRFVGA